MSSTDTPTLTAAADSNSTSPVRRRRRRGEQIAKIGFVVPAALVMVLLFGYPVVKNLTMSFQDYGLKTFFTGKAPFVGLENYVQVVTDPIFTKAMANTAIFTIASIAFQFVIGMLLALIFRGVAFEFRFRAHTERSRALWDLVFFGG